MRFYCLLFLAFLASCAYDNVEEIAPPKAECQTPAIVSYSQSIYPLLNRNCLSCHAAALRTAGVNLEDFAELKSRAGTGQLMAVVTHAPNAKKMPYQAAKLSDCDIALLQKWVDAGAPQN